MAIDYQIPTKASIIQEVLMAAMHLGLRRTVQCRLGNG